MITSLDLQPFFPSELVIQDVKTVSNTVYIEMKSKTTTIRCPKCGKEISKYHAVHKRTVQDLPILGNRTFLKLSLYEFDCDNQDCPCVSVTENFDGFLNGYSRMTERLADFINSNADEIRKCIAARTKTDGELELTLTTGGEIGSLHAVLTIDDKKYKKKMAKTVDGEAFEAWVEVVTEEYHKEKDMFIKKVQAKQRKLKIYGSLLHLTILRSIARREGCEWPETDRYEWIENIIEKEIKKVQAKQTSMMFGFDDVVQAVNDLIMCGLLRKTDKKTFAGRCGEEFAPRAKNMILKPGADYMIFAQLPFKRKFDFSEFSDIDWLDWIKYRKTEWNDMGDEAVLLPTKSGNEELCSELSIFEHSPVVLSCPDEMRAFLTGRPQTWVDYVLTMKEIAETDGEKRYWLMVRRMMG